MFQESKQFSMIDLHGASVAHAEQLVNYWLVHASRYGINQLRVVTGRGNHVNTQQKRGTLYKKFPEWIRNSIYKDRIAQCKKYNGYYEIVFKPTQKQLPTNSFFEATAKQFVTDNVAMIKDQANAGQAEFQMLYAGLLECGDGVKQDFKQAAEFYRLASDNNHAPAMHALARCYLHGMGVRQNDKTAVFWLEKADALNYSESTISLGDCYFYGEVVKLDPRRAVSYYAKAAGQHQHPVAMRKLANAYSQGIHAPKNITTAFQWYKKAADLGEVIAQYNVGSHYHTGSGVERNEQEACRYWQLAADGGDPDAQFGLGLNYRQGQGVEKDTEQAMYWLKKASENGSSQASFLLSKISDKHEQALYLKRAAQSGNFLAEFQLESANKQLTTEELQEKLSTLMSEAYNLGDNDIILLEPRAKFLLLDTMLSDKKLKYRKKALAAIQSMAEQNCIFSLRRLVVFYFYGYKSLNITKDISQAISYLQQGIKAGDSSALVMLGRLYADGVGVKQSNEQAYSLYRDALQQHHPIAYYLLAIMHMNGSLGEIKLQQAIEYFKLAIHYEQQPKVMYHLSSGLRDKYQAVSESAKETLLKIDNLLKSQARTVAARLEEVTSHSNVLEILNTEFKLESTHKESNIHELQKKLLTVLPDAFNLKPNDIILLEPRAKFLLLDIMLSSKTAEYRDKALAVLEAMVKQNCIFSLRRLASFYFYGYDDLNIIQDIPQAITYVRRCIALGDSKALVKFGGLYEDGIGVEQSYEKAYAFYQQASQQHNPSAYFLLANMHMNGLLGEINLEQAAEYLKLAIYYDKQPEVVRHLSSGFRDCYRPVSEVAKQCLLEIDALLNKAAYMTTQLKTENVINPITPLETLNSEETSSENTEEERVENPWRCGIM